LRAPRRFFAGLLFGVGQRLTDFFRPTRQFLFQLGQAFLGNTDFELSRFAGLTLGLALRLQFGFNPRALRGLFTGAFGGFFTGQAGRFLAALQLGFHVANLVSRPGRIGLIGLLRRPRRRFPRLQFFLHPRAVVAFFLNAPFQFKLRLSGFFLAACKVSFHFTDFVRRPCRCGLIRLLRDARGFLPLQQFLLNSGAVVAFFPDSPLQFLPGLLSLFLARDQFILQRAQFDGGLLGFLLDFFTRGAFGFFAGLPFGFNLRAALGFFAGIALGFLAGGDRFQFPLTQLGFQFRQRAPAA